MQTAGEGRESPRLEAPRSFTCGPGTAWHAYGLSIAVMLVIVLVRFSLEPWLDGNAPLLALLLPVAIAAAYGGALPGLVATVLSALIGVLLFLRPIGSLTVASLPDQARLGVFLVVGTTLSLLNERGRRATLRRRPRRPCVRARPSRAASSPSWRPRTRPRRSGSA